jgi:hypothetical protein
MKKAAGKKASRKVPSPTVISLTGVGITPVKRRVTKKITKKATKKATKK